MFTRVITYFLFSFLLLINIQNSFSSSYLSELSSEEIQELNTGEMIVKEYDMDAPWPKVRTYNYIMHKPNILSALFSDFTLYPKMFDQLSKAEILSDKQVIKRYGKDDSINNPLIVYADFRMELPLNLGSEDYTVKNYFEMNNQKDFYVYWSMVESNQSKDIQGSIRFVEVNNRTLMIYENFVHPDVWGAGALSWAFVKNVKSGSEDLREYLEDTIQKMSQDQKEQILNDFLNRFSK